jgi:transposase-like protein
MKRARLTEEQIVAALKEHEAWAKTADLTRKHGISEATIYNWNQIWRHGRLRGQAAEGVGGGKREARADARRSRAP